MNSTFPDNDLKISSYWCTSWMKVGFCSSLNWQSVHFISAIVSSIVSFLSSKSKELQSSLEDGNNGFNKQGST